MLPYERLFSYVPNYNELRIFGFTCFVLLPKRKRDKLGKHTALCVFLGYGTKRKGYRCFDLETNQLHISHHVTFWEHIRFSSLSQSPPLMPVLDPFDEPSCDTLMIEIPTATSVPASSKHDCDPPP